MMRLSERDHLAVLNAAHGVAGATTRDGFVRVALRQMSGLIRSDVTSLNEVDPAAGRLVFAAEPVDFAFPDDGAAVFAELAHAHPLIRHYANTGDGSAFKISDLCSEQTWHDSAIFQRFYGRMGIEFQMSITLPAPLPIVVGLAFNRVCGDFTERDRTVLNLLRPHLAQAWRRAREYEHLDMLVTAASGAFAAGGSGVIVLADPVQELTAGSLVSLYRFFGRPAPCDPLPPRVARWLERQRRDAHRSGGGLEIARPLRAVLGGRQLVLRRLPAARGRPDVLLLNEQPADVASPELIAAGLSDREATVLSLAGSGATNVEIAAELSLSPWTVKRHLANIYAKLGVSGRVRATAVALAITAHHCSSPAVRLPTDRVATGHVAR